MRSRRLAGLAAVTVLVVAGSTLGYRWVTSSRPVSTDRALQRYREGLSATAVDAGPTPAATPAPSAAIAAAASSRSPAGGAPTKVEGATATPDVSWWHRPSDGVYTYTTTGYEKATFSRNYPSTTQRIIGFPDPSTYDNHHIFSEEHEEWFTLRPTDAGGTMVKRRMRVTFGPVTVDQTVSFDPPLLGVPVPYQLGETWSGKWSGPTSGTYTAKTIDHRSIDIAGEAVEVWVNELKLEMHGKANGTVTTKLWWAPKLGVDAREDGVYDMTVDGTPGRYHTEYTLTLASTHAQR